jgi:SH3-like domain-containing protein
MKRLSEACVVILLMSGFSNAVQDKEERQVPRFAFLKSDKVNVRLGPTPQHDVSFVYKQAGLPVEITAEFESWRRIRDWEGTEGWVQHTMLAGGKKQVMVLPSRQELTPVYKEETLQGAVTAKLEPRVIASVKSCNMQVCFIQHKDFEGYIAQNRLWGVYANEKF